MIKTVIVEDEAVAARRLQKMLEKEGLIVEQHLKSNKALQSYLDSGKAVDLFFMDIHLSDGIVFETLLQTTVQIPIIFTTAYDEYAIKAFKQKSVDYLLKPIDKVELHQAIEKFKEIYRHKPPALDIAAIQQLLQPNGASYRERIKVRVGDHLRSIKIQEVQVVYSEQKITFIQTQNGRSYPIEQSLDKISAELNPTSFFRINRSHLIHIDAIQDIIAYTNSRLKVLLIPPLSKELIVARERVKDFKAWLG